MGFVELAPPTALLQLSAPPAGTSAHLALPFSHMLGALASQDAGRLDFMASMPGQWQAPPACSGFSRGPVALMSGDVATPADASIMIETMDSPWSWLSTGGASPPDISFEICPARSQVSHSLDVVSIDHVRGAILAELSEEKAQSAATAPPAPVASPPGLVGSLLFTPESVPQERTLASAAPTSPAHGPSRLDSGALRFAGLRAADDAAQAASEETEKPCSCFCPISEAGVLPVPPVAGHAMVTVDAGTTALMIGGYCLEWDAKVGASAGSVFTSKSWYLRIGRGPPPAAVLALANRVLSLQEQAAAKATPTASPAPSVADSESVLLQQQEREGAPKPWSALRRRLARRGSRRSALRTDIRFLTTFGMAAVPEDGTGSTGFVWQEVGAAPPGIVAYGEKAAPPSQSHMARGVNRWFPPPESKRWRLTGVAMRPRAGHTAVSLGRYAGDGGSVEAWLRLFSASHAHKAPTLDKETEVHWPLRAAAADEPQEQQRKALHPGEHVFLRAARGERYEYLEDEAAQQSPHGRSAASGGSGEWIPVVSPLPVPDPDGAASASASDAKDSARAVLERPAYIGYQINATASLFDAIVIFGGSDGGTFRPGRCGGRGSGAAQPPPASSFSSKEGCGYFDDLWVLLRFASPAHAACAQPGSDGWSCWLPPRSKGSSSSAEIPPPSETLQGFGVSPSYAQALAVSGAANAPVTIGFRLVGGASYRDPAAPAANASASNALDRGAPRPTEDTGFNAAASTNLEAAFSVGRVDATRLATHLRDPLHYAWTWRWWPASRLGAVTGHGRLSPSARDGHSASVVAGELMVVIGGRGPVPGAPARTRVFVDVHALHIPTLTWLPVTLLSTAAGLGRVAAPSEGPAPRARHSATAAGAAIYVYGGQGETSVLGDVWVLRTGCAMAAAGSGGAASAEASFAPPPVSAERDYAVPLPVRRSAPTCEAVRPLTAGSPDTRAPLAAGSAVTRELVRLTSSAAVSALAETRGGLAFSWQRLEPVGVSPGSRVGHAALLIGHRLAFFAGYRGPGDAEDGAWRLKRRRAGLRSDVVSLALPLPRVEALEPRAVPPAGGVRVTLRGRAFGSCRDWRAVNGVPLCAATCIQGAASLPGDRPERRRCDPRDLSTWVDNNAAAVARIDIGGAPCLRIAWHSPQALSCELGAGVGRFGCGDFPAAPGDPDRRGCGVVVTLADGLTTTADIYRAPDENVRPGGPAPPLFHVLAPAILAASPASLVDHPPRGPIVLLGRHFGARESHVLGRESLVGGRGGAAAGAVVFGGGQLRADGSIAFAHTRATLRSALYSHASGTDGRSAATGPWLGVVIWVGRRPCLRAVWYSDAVLACECVGGDRRPARALPVAAAAAAATLLKPKVFSRRPNAKPAVELLARTVETTLGGASVSGLAGTWEDDYEPNPAGESPGRKYINREDEAVILGESGGEAVRPRRSQRRMGRVPRPWVPGAVVAYVHGRRSAPFPFKLLVPPGPPSAAALGAVGPSCPAEAALAPLRALLLDTHKRAAADGRPAHALLPARDSNWWRSLMMQLTRAVSSPAGSAASGGEAEEVDGASQPPSASSSLSASPSPSLSAKQGAAAEAAAPALLVELAGLLAGGGYARGRESGLQRGAEPLDAAKSLPLPLSIHDSPLTTSSSRFRGAGGGIGEKRAGAGRVGDQEAAAAAASRADLEAFCVLRVSSVEERFTGFGRLLGAARAALSSAAGQPHKADALIDAFVRGVAWVGVSPAAAAASPPSSSAAGRVANALASRLLEQPGAGAGAAAADAGVGARRDLLSPGCGCGGLVGAVHRAARLQISDVPPACRRSLREYAWGLGCADIAAQWASAGCASGDAGHCASLSTLAETRCAATSAATHLDDLFNVALTLLRPPATGASGGRLGDARFAAAASSGDPEESSAASSADAAAGIPPPVVIAPDPPDVIGLLTAGASGGIAFALASTAAAAAQPPRPFHLSALVPEWEEGGGAASRRLLQSVCPLGVPPSPRQRAAGTLLADGRTVVLHGGRGEASGSRLARSLQSFPGRSLPPTTLADTFVLAVVPTDAWADLGLPVDAGGRPGRHCSSSSSRSSPGPGGEAR